MRNSMVNRFSYNREHSMGCVNWPNPPYIYFAVQASRQYQIYIILTVYCDTDNTS